MTLHSDSILCELVTLNSDSLFYKLTALVTDRARFWDPSDLKTKKDEEQRTSQGLIKTLNESSSAEIGKCFIHVYNLL